MSLTFLNSKLCLPKVLWHILCLGMATNAFAVTEIDNKKIDLQSTTTKSIEAARVISCAIQFPLDSVKFSEKQVTSCLNSAKLESVSYIHVIATASSTGSGTHNLYLSTRRAGAIEAYINNRYPDLKVHAFGGGENPKFGKMARIFIVENHGKPNQLATGAQLASAGPPEIIERTTTKFITKTEYRERPKDDYDVSVDSGAAATNFGNAAYNYVAMKMTKKLRFDFFGDVIFGLRHRVLQSNEGIDINSTNFMIGRDFNLAHFYGRRVFYGQTIETGPMMTNNRSIEFGTSATLGLQTADFRVSMVATMSNHLNTIGLGLGLRM